MIDCLAWRKEGLWKCWILFGEWISINSKVCDDKRTKFDEHDFVIKEGGGHLNKNEREN